jgi:hypothetical protein
MFGVTSISPNIDAGSANLSETAGGFKSRPRNQLIRPDRRISLGRWTFSHLHLRKSRNRSAKARFFRKNSELQEDIS